MSYGNDRLVMALKGGGGGGMAMTGGYGSELCDMAVRGELWQCQGVMTVRAVSYGSDTGIWQ